MTEPAPDFFQPDQHYRRRRWTFQCLAVDTAPWDEQLRAVGFLLRSDGTGTVHGMTADDWGHGEWIVLPDDEPDQCPECGTTRFDFDPNHDDGISIGPAWLCTECKWGVRSVYN